MNCLQSKKQKMNGEQQNHHQSNGHSSLHNGYQEHNGHGTASVMPQQKVANIEMCVFCFDTLHAELNNLGSIGYTPRFTNDA